MNTNKKSFIRAFEADFLKYLLIFFIFLLLIFFWNLKEAAMYEDDFFLFSLNYGNIGFVPKIFIGTLISSFTDFVSERLLYKLYIAFAVFFSFILSFCISNVLISAKTPEEKASINAAIIITLIGSVSVAYTLTSFPFDLLEACNFILCIAFSRNKYLKYLIPLLIFCGVATHQLYSFAYMPTIALLLLYNLMFDKNKFKSNLILFIISIIVMGLSSCYFYLFTICFKDNMKLSTFEEIKQLIDSRTDVVYEQNFIRAYFTLGAFDLIGIISQWWRDGYYWDVIKTLLPSLPFFIFASIIWMKSLKKSDCKKEKFIFFLCLMVPLAYVPLYIISTNHGTDLSAGVICEATLFSYFFMSRNSTFLQVVNRLYTKIVSNKILIVILFSYLFYWSCFTFYPEGYELCF